MFPKLTWTLETPFGNPQSTPGTLWDFLKYLLDALSEILRQLSRHSGNLLKTL
jgi:hypothetical protein